MTENKTLEIGKKAFEHFTHGLENEKTVIFEFRDEGLFRGVPYKNRVAISKRSASRCAFDIRGDKICAYREYYGSDGKSN
ncbi:MAG: hypothetical protein QNJ42_21215 [Crocosphaera sp.]|nr:hypothetical protein [Crocosphaera sp.]